MNKGFYYNSFPAGFPSRLIFQKSPDKPSPSTEQPAKSDQDKQKLDAAILEARKKAKAGAVEQAKAAVNQNPPVNPDKPKMPELPNKIQGLKTDPKLIKENPNGTFEQPFTFGDQKIAGKMILPKNSDPGAKTTYLFNYVSDPAKFDHSTFLEEMKKRKQDLGNTVIITLKTPEGETHIDQKKVNTMQKLMGDLEVFQNQLQQDPKFSNLKLTRPEKVFHLCEKGQEEGVKSLLEKYKKIASDNDGRAAISKIYENNPQAFLDQLEKVSTGQSGEPIDPLTGKPYEVGQGKAMGSSGHGGVSSGGGSHSPSGSGGGGGLSNKLEDSPKSLDNSNPTELPGQKMESGGEYLGNFDEAFMVGDSIMVGALMSKYGRSYKEKTSERSVAEGGRATSDMLKRVKKWDEEGKLKSFSGKSMLFNCGVNDLAGAVSAEQILSNIREIFAIAAKNKINVIACTLAPFGGAEGWKGSLRNNYDKKEAARQKINEEMYKMLGIGGGITKLVELHKPVKDGGVADNDDPSKLAKEFDSGDHLHLSGKGAKLMVEGFEKALGKPGQIESKVGQKPPEVSFNSTGLKPASESGKDFYDFSTKINQGFIDANSPYGSSKIVEYKGKKYLAVHRLHNLQAATGKHGNFPATEMYEYDPNHDPGLKKKSENLSIGNLERGLLDQGKVEFMIDYPVSFRPGLPSELIIYATPNGANIDHAYNSNLIAGQTAELRQSKTYENKNLIVAYISPNNKKWPVYLHESKSSAFNFTNQIRDSVSKKIGANNLNLSIDGFSGGGAFAFNLLNRFAEIPDEINQLTFYDAIYEYNGIMHAMKIKKWLESNSNHRFINITGTPQIEAKQSNMIADLNKLGVKFIQKNGPGNTTVLSAYDGRLSFTQIEGYSHDGTVKRHGFSSSHSNEFHISSKADASNDYLKLATSQKQA